MKKIILVFIFLFQFTICHPKETLEIKKLPHKDALIEKIYKLDNGNFIYVEQWQRGDIIWEYDIKTNKFTEISKVWNFIALASNCEMIKGINIYFATILEYWFAGGTKIDYPEIRIFNLYETKPWRDSDIGISPDMAYAKEWCTIIKPYYIVGN